MTQALVVFTDDGRHPLSPLLKPGFRHVLAAIRDGHYWAVVDAAEGLPKVTVTAVDDLAEWYREHGCTVIEIEQRETLRTPVLPVNCVSMVVAVVGIRCWALTPYQLFKHLRKR